MRKYDIPPLYFLLKTIPLKCFLSFYQVWINFRQISPIFPELIFINLFAVILFNIYCVFPNRY